MSIIPPAVPDDLTERDQWVLWRYETRDGKRTKVPYQPNNRRAKTDDPSTWRPYSEVCDALRKYERSFAGAGYVFASVDPYAGIDFDNCLDGCEVKPWAQPYLERFSDTYGEKSPSGQGVKIFAKGKLPGKGKRKDFGGYAIEIYDERRFFAVTGQAFNGAPLQIEDHQADIEKLYEFLSRGRSSDGAAGEAATEAKIPQGQRHNTLVSLAGSMRRRGMTVDEIDTALWAVNCNRCEPPYDRKHIRDIAESSGKWKPSCHPVSANLLCQPYTDTGNAERLLATHGGDILFCPETEKRLVWDGRRWNSRDERCVKILAKHTMRQMYAQATKIDEVEHPKEKAAAEKHARASESAGGIKSMLACAEYEDGIPVFISELDQHKFLLNVLNGTLDLRTGLLREHRREDRITKLVHFNYRKDAQCPLFLKFLDRIMGGGPNAGEEALERAKRLAGYLRTCFGYALTADVSEKVVLFFFGCGNNGKTTLLEIVRYVIAEYSAQVLIDSLMQHSMRETNASLADLGDLCGARFVTTSEAEEGQRLAVGKLKYLTQGMGEIKTCRKYENPIRFAATHKLFLDANHKPIVRGAETAVWNRLKLVPFTVTIPAEEIDKTLLDKLKNEAEGILAWMVEGCRLWLAEGLGDPPEVSAASAAWQAESDRFPAFIEEKCVLAKDVEEDPENVWIRVAQLWSCYQTWCEINNERGVLAKTAFDARLNELGCRPARREKNTVRVWEGIRLRTPEDDQKGRARS